MANKLVSNVWVENKWYGPDYGNAEVPDHIAEQILNLSAWGDEVPDIVQDEIERVEAERVEEEEAAQAEAAAGRKAVVAARDKARKARVAAAKKASGEPE